MAFATEAATWLTWSVMSQEQLGECLVEADGHRSTWFSVGNPLCMK